MAAKTSFLLLLLLALLRLTLSEPVVWIGAVTANSFIIHLDVTVPPVTAILLATDEAGTNVVETRVPANADLIDQPVYNDLRRYEFNGLDARTKYYVLLQDPAALSVAAAVRTFPDDGDPTDVSVAFSSSQWFKRLDFAFEDVRDRYDAEEDAADPKPFFFLHMGDMHEREITTPDVPKFEAAMRPLLERTRVHSVFSRMPVPYMYDDHDYGDNYGFVSPLRPAALENYKAMVPHYPFPFDPAIEDATYHAFTVGTIRFIITDLHANKRRDPDSMLGTTQRDWFFSELANWQNFDVVVWVNVKPWIGRVGIPTTLESNEETWAGFANEREIIANEISNIGITNMVMVGGDARMLAFDDGSNSDYCTDPGCQSGFPVFQAGPIGHFASSKGGPYSSEECKGFTSISANYHYGLLEITDLGLQPPNPSVKFRGFSDGEEVITFSKSGQLSGVNGAGGQEATCPLQLGPQAFQTLLQDCGTLDKGPIMPKDTCPLQTPKGPADPVLGFFQALIQTRPEEKPEETPTETPTVAPTVTPAATPPNENV